uniref:Uncharacterized protein n=1 Tax=Mycena chlorophos TaxID=658473 RepID=A0ABQ0LH44_MYCCL|nr:predicted protein [Mycena chlorophos]
MTDPPTGSYFVRALGADPLCSCLLDAGDRGVHILASNFQSDIEPTPEDLFEAFKRIHNAECSPTCPTHEHLCSDPPPRLYCARSRDDEHMSSGVAWPRSANLVAPNAALLGPESLGSFDDSDLPPFYHLLVVLQTPHYFALIQGPTEVVASSCVLRTQQQVLFVAATTLRNDPCLREVGEAAIRQHNQLCKNGANCATFSQCGLESVFYTVARDASDRQSRATKLDGSDVRYPSASLPAALHDDILEIPAEPLDPEGTQVVHVTIQLRSSKRRVQATEGTSNPSAKRRRTSSNSPAAPGPTPALQSGVLGPAAPSSAGSVAQSALAFDPTLLRIGDPDLGLFIVKSTEPSHGKSFMFKEGRKLEGADTLISDITFAPLDLISLAKESDGSTVAAVNHGGLLDFASYAISGMHHPSSRWDVDEDGVSRSVYWFGLDVHGWDGIASATLSRRLVSFYCGYQLKSPSQDPDLTAWLRDNSQKDPPAALRKILASLHFSSLSFHLI